MSHSQYKIAFKNENGKTSYFKPKVHRMWFYHHDKEGGFELIDYAENHVDYTSSHLCHQSECYNPKHLCL